MARKAKKKAVRSGKMTANEKRVLALNVRKARSAMIAAVDSSHAASLNRFRDRIHNAAKANGWWDLHRDVGTLLMLTVSELSKAMEGHRKDLQDDKLPHRKMFDVELADALIRILDLAGSRGIDIGAIAIEKLAYNAQRADVPKRDKGKNRKRF